MKLLCQAYFSNGGFGIGSSSPPFKGQVWLNPYSDLSFLALSNIMESNKIDCQPAVFRMNPDVKAKWLEALRSKTYPQATEVLRNDSGFCCLGVLTDIYLTENGEKWDKDDDSTEYSFQDEYDVLPDSVCKWAGLQNDLAIPKVPIKYVSEENTEFSENYLPSLPQLNDLRYTFKYLADIIENEL